MGVVLRYQIYILQIRLFGDPATRGVELPTQIIRLVIEVEDFSLAEPFVHEPSQDVICDFLGGYAFGDALGIGLRSISGWWTVVDVVARDENVSCFFQLFGLD